MDDFVLERDERGIYSARFDTPRGPCFHSLDTDNLAVAVRVAEAIAERYHRSGSAA